MKKETKLFEKMNCRKLFIIFGLILLLANSKGQNEDDSGNNNSADDVDENETGLDKYHFNFLHLI